MDEELLRCAQNESKCYKIELLKIFFVKSHWKENHTMFCFIVTLYMLYISSLRNVYFY